MVIVQLKECHCAGYTLAGDTNQAAA